MSDSLALPAAQPPPLSGLRPPAQPGAGQAADTASGPPFEAVLAEAEVEADAALPLMDASVLAALAALLNVPGRTQPIAAPSAEPPAAEAPDAQPLVSSPAPGAPSLALAETISGGAMPEAAPDPQSALQAARGFQSWMTAASTAVATADAATVSAEALNISAQPATPKIPVAARASATDPAPDVQAQTMVMPGAAAATAPTQPMLEPARLAEASELKTPTASPEAVLPQVVRGVETLSRSGQTTLHVHLQPESLGRIDLQLTTGVEGVRVTMTADLPATGSLLQQHLVDLRESLAASGLTVAGLSVGLGQHQGGAAFTWQQARTAPLMTSAESAARPVEAGLDSVPAISNGARVDYRI